MATQDKNEGTKGPLAQQFVNCNANEDNKRWAADWAPKVEAAQKALSAAKGSGKGTKPAWDAWVEEQKVQLAKAEAKPAPLPEDSMQAAEIKFTLFKKTNGNPPVPDPGPFSDGGSGMTADILKDIMILKVRVKDPAEAGNRGALESQLADFEAKLAVAQAEYDAAFNKLAKERNCMNCGCVWGLTFIILGCVVFAAALVFTFFPVYMQVFTWPWYEIACWAWAILGLTMLFLGCFCFCCGKSKDNDVAAREVCDDGEVRAPIPYVMLDP